jgi:hypothetical protein
VSSCTRGHGPIAFFSRLIVPRHSKLAAYERELIGLVQAVRHWHPYLWGHAFIICTDHYSLKFVLDQCLSTIPQHQWPSKLMGFDFSVEYKPSVTNVVVDALSRCHGDETGEVMVILAPTFEIFDDLHQEIKADPEMQKLKEEVAAKGRVATWGVVEGLLSILGCIFVPCSSTSLQALLTSVHGTDHEGTQKTLHRLRADFHVPGTWEVVRDFV